MATTIITTSRIPHTIPALKMPPTTPQLWSVKINAKSIEYKINFFISFCDKGCKFYSMGFYNQKNSFIILTNRVEYLIPH